MAASTSPTAAITRSSAGPCARISLAAKYSRVEIEDEQEIQVLEQQGAETAGRGGRPIAGGPSRIPPEPPECRNIFGEAAP